MATPATATSEVQLPGAQTLLQAAKVSLDQDKPIQLDYFLDSLAGKAFLGEDETTHEKMLVKSSDEYTSLVQKIFRVPNGDFLVITENSIYIVSAKLQKRKIQAANYLGNE